jgi:anti-anti-sigma regulatory factor
MTQPAAMKVRTRNGSVTLLNPRPAVARILELLRAGEMSASDAGQRETQPDTSADGS